MTGVHLTAHAVVGLLVVDMLAALALAAAGTAITAIIPSAQSAQPVLMLTYIPLIVLGGAFGAITSLPHWVNTAMTYLPVQPGDRRRVARAAAQRGDHVGSRPGGPGRLGGGRPAGLVPVLRLGSAPPGARRAGRGKHHAPFGRLKNRSGAGRTRYTADRPAARVQGRQQRRQPRRGGRTVPPRRPAGRVNARSGRPRC